MAFRDILAEIIRSGQDVVNVLTRPNSLVGIVPDLRPSVPLTSQSLTFPAPKTDMFLGMEQGLQPETQPLSLASLEEFMRSTDFVVAPEEPVQAVSVAPGAPPDLSPLELQLIAHEGVRNKVYTDPTGNPTIGAGFNLNKEGAKEQMESLGLNYDDVKSGKVKLNNSQIFALLKEDLSQAIRDARAYAGKAWSNLSDVRKRVLVDLAFSTGAGTLAKFKVLKEALLEEDYTKAAQALKNSKWYSQTKTRGQRLVKAMLTDSIDIG